MYQFCSKYLNATYAVFMQNNSKAIATITPERTRTVKISMSVVCTTDAKWKTNDNAHAWYNE